MLTDEIFQVLDGSNDIESLEEVMKDPKIEQHGMSHLRFDLYVYASQCVFCDFDDKCRQSEKTLR